MSPADASDAHDDLGDPGDLGRRVTQRRTELGLSVEELAHRAGMHPSYLSYVEHQSTARPNEAACTRLAAALGTTVSWLRGGGGERPVGAVPDPGGVPQLEELDTAQCAAHLDGGGIGRAVFDDDQGPVALPINYRMVDGQLVFRTGDGTIAAAVRAGRPISVEVDHLDEVVGEGWSVLVRGQASEVTDPERLAALDRLAIHPWAGGDRHTTVALQPTSLTGRRILRRF
jgi:nitroimidazol reductase NimA-like FMN-containing flavoprotein (pyridoxamine 5'-phosphate oxidase superfamily)